MVSVVYIYPVLRYIQRLSAWPLQWPLWISYQWFPVSNLCDLYPWVCTYPSLYSSDECVGKPAPPVTVWLDGIYFWTRSFGLLFPGDPAVLTWFLVFTFSVCVSYVDANPFTSTPKMRFLKRWFVKASFMKSKYFASTHLN